MRPSTLALLFLAACTHAESAGPDGGSGGGGAAASAACYPARQTLTGDAACATGKGGPMRQIPAPGGATMCVDETEVTVGDYQAFLAAGVVVTFPDADPAKARCEAKTTYAPSCAEAACVGAGCDLPQTCVDQCDAKAYCRWAGKRLCGAFGGGALAIADVDDPSKNQWANACAAGGSAWPYGADYDGQACNTSDHQPAACGGPAVTAGYPRCQPAAGPYDGVYDMSGNVSEWSDASEEGADWPEQRCVILGGSYVHYWGDVSCSGATLEWPCNAQNPEFGFRCCSL
jgi:formylglycine-generating enzyme required for sulfatase activity